MSNTRAPPKMTVGHFGSWAQPEPGWLPMADPLGSIDELEDLQLKRISPGSAHGLALLDSDLCHLRIHPLRRYPLFSSLLGTEPDMLG